jgi:hypothetical protein
MAGRLSPPRLIALAAALALAACVGVGVGTDPPRPPETPEEELELRARALQRTVQEAAVAGAVAGAGGVYVFGGRGGPGPAIGLIGGIPIGAATGTYVGYLQQQYASNEDRLERLRADIELTNAETAAAIRTMQVVLDQQRRELAALRASGASEALGGEIRDAEANLQNMALAVDGAEDRLAEFNSTRALRLVEGQLTGVDAQIGELSRRIAEMRTIAATLAEEV